MDRKIEKIKTKKRRKKKKITNKRAESGGGKKKKKKKNPGNKFDQLYKTLNPLAGTMYRNKTRTELGRKMMIKLQKVN